MGNPVSPLPYEFISFQIPFSSGAVILHRRRQPLLQPPESSEPFEPSFPFDILTI
jgi:hypothetical protein